LPRKLVGSPQVVVVAERHPTASGGIDAVVSGPADAPGLVMTYNANTIIAESLDRLASAIVGPVVNHYDLEFDVSLPPDGCQSAFEETPAVPRGNDDRDVWCYD
jgi:hypothetical protein